MYNIERKSKVYKRMSEITFYIIIDNTQHSHSHSQLDSRFSNLFLLYINMQFIYLRLQGEMTNKLSMFNVAQYTKN